MKPNFAAVAAALAMSMWRAPTYRTAGRGPRMRPSRRRFIGSAREGCAEKKHACQRARNKIARLSRRKNRRA